MYKTFSLAFKSGIYKVYKEFRITEQSSLNKASLCVGWERANSLLQIPSYIRQTNTYTIMQQINSQSKLRCFRSTQGLGNSISCSICLLSAILFHVAQAISNRIFIQDKSGFSHDKFNLKALNQLLHGNATSHQNTALCNTKTSF